MKLTREQIFNLELFDRELVMELASTEALDTGGRVSERPWEEDGFPEQSAFIADERPRVVACCTRRAGKSEGLARKFLNVGSKFPGQLSLYIAVSKELCTKILWSALKILDKRYSLGLKFTEKNQQLTVVLPNHHQIWLSGCPTAADVGKFRGPKYAMAAIDEGQKYPPWIEELVEEVLDPACMDLKGQIYLAGTPGPIPKGYYYEASTGDRPGWAVHRWSLFNNPHIPHAAEWLEQKMALLGISREHPSIRREYFGEWVLDTGSLVYPFNEDINSIDAIPIDRPLIYGLGIDLGYESPSAFVIVAYSPGHPDIYVLTAFKRSGMIPSRVAAEIARLEQSYRFSEIVCDAGGLGIGYVQEFNQTHALSVKPAQKTNKRGYQELTRGELLSGQVKVYYPKCRDLVEEWNSLQWSDAACTEEHPDGANHCADAALYIMRSLRPFYRPQEAGPKPGTTEYLNAEMARHKRETIMRAARRTRRT